MPRGILIIKIFYGVTYSENHYNNLWWYLDMLHEEIRGVNNKEDVGDARPKRFFKLKYLTVLWSAVTSAEPLRPFWALKLNTESYFCHSH
jgi:hypothetical protein